MTALLALLTMTTATSTDLARLLVVADAAVVQVAVVAAVHVVVVALLSFLPLLPFLPRLALLALLRVDSSASAMMSARTVVLADIGTVSVAVGPGPLRLCLRPVDDHNDRTRLEGLAFASSASFIAGRDSAESRWCRPSPPPSAATSCLACWGIARDEAGVAAAVNATSSAASSVRMPAPAVNDRAPDIVSPWDSSGSRGNRFIVRPLPGADGSDALGQCC